MTFLIVKLSRTYININSGLAPFLIFRGQELSEHQRLRFPYRPAKTLLPVLFSSFYHSVSQEELICQCRYTFKQGTIAALFKYYYFANCFQSTQLLFFLEDSQSCRRISSKYGQSCCSITSHNTLNNLQIYIINISDFFPQFFS